jgi:poly(A) polymerase
MSDLKNRIVRVIGDPDVRLLEDPVRMLRVIRHAARSGFDINEDCRKSILKNHELLTHSPAMRLYEEIKKDLTSGCFLEILRLLNDTELLQHLLPELAGRNGDLLNDSTGLAQMLGRVDTYAKDEIEIPLTAILSAISLFLQADDIPLDRLAERFEGRDEIKDHVESAFTDLAVPRKERERIEDTLLLWWKIVSSDPNRIKIPTLERRKAIEDVFWLLKLTSYNSSQHDDLIDIAAQACASRKKQLRRRKGSGDGRQRSRRSGNNRQDRGGSRRQGSSRKTRKK